jgi:cytochrome c biogenesis protein
VLLIICLAVAGVIGTVVRQFPAFALHDRAAYAEQVAEMHQRWDAIAPFGVVIGPTLVDIFEKLGFFRVFSAPWFLLLLTILVVSIVCCTLDRTPRLWRGVREVRVQQPSPFFDIRLADRAVVEGSTLDAEAIGRVFRGHRFRVRQVTSDDGAVTWVYGDRNQYTKMATLLTHLGLILFLAGGAVTVAAGFETVVFVGEGQSAPVRPVGTPDNLLVKVNSFEAPRLPNGGFADFRTDLSVYQNGAEVARKTIRVNDPLALQGYVFHQNTFGPAAELEIRDPEGRVAWSGPVVLAGELLDAPQGFLTIPGSDEGLLILLAKTSDGGSALLLQGIPPGSAGQDVGSSFGPVLLGLGATTDPAATGGWTITWVRAGAWTGLVVKNDPGEWLIWVAFLSLITGLSITFYLPRRRIWARLEGGRASFAMLADRYVDVPRELRVVLEEVAIRGGTRPAVTSRR